MTATYCQRPNAFRGQTCYEVTDRTLEVTEGENRRVIPYEDIGTIRLDYAPTRLQTSLYRMRIHSRQGSALAITNQSYKGFASFIAHDAEYVDFARDLHEAIARSGATVTFRAGSTPLAYIVNAAIVLFTGFLLAVFLPLFFAGYGPTGIIIARLVVIAFMLPIVALFMRRNWPKAYQPSEIPATALPKTTAG